MRQMRRIDEICPRKGQGSEHVTDIEPLFTEYSEHWEMFSNKCYQGAAELLRVIHPIKRLPNKHPSTSEESYNGKLSSDIIVVEKVLGEHHDCGLR